MHGSGGLLSGWLKTALLAGSFVLLASGIVQAQEPKTFTSKSSFDDVKFELNNAIVARGLAVESTSRLGDMLARTAADVGSAKQIYKSAELLSFCSARYSRRMMEADPVNIGFCPFVIFIYETVDVPGQVVVGYRAPAQRGNDASKAALMEIDQLLEGIITEAVKP